MNAKAKEAMFSLRDVLQETDPDIPTVSVYRHELEIIIRHLFRSGEEWSNQSAFGYAIAASEQNGMSPGRIQKLVNAMRAEFDNVTLEEAADIYRKSDY